MRALHFLVAITGSQAGFCYREEQIKEEVGKCLQMLDEVYRVFGLSYTAELSTRPESRMGEEAQWDRAETALQEALEAQEAKTGHGWKVSLSSFIGMEAEDEFLHHG